MQNNKSVVKEMEVLNKEMEVLKNELRKQEEICNTTRRKMSNLGMKMSRLRNIQNREKVKVFKEHLKSFLESFAFQNWELKSKMKMTYPKDKGHDYEYEPLVNRCWKVDGSWNNEEDLEVRVILGHLHINQDLDSKKAEITDIDKGEKKKYVFDEWYYRANRDHWPGNRVILKKGKEVIEVCWIDYCDAHIINGRIGEDDFEYLDDGNSVGYYIEREKEEKIVPYRALKMVKEAMKNPTGDYKSQLIINNKSLCFLDSDEEEEDRSNRIQIRKKIYKSDIIEEDDDIIDYESESD